MLKVTDEMLTGMEEIFKTQLYWRYGMLKQKRCSWKFTIQKEGIEFFSLENALKKAVFDRLGCI